MKPKTSFSDKYRASRPASARYERVGTGDIRTTGYKRPRRQELMLDLLRFVDAIRGAETEGQRDLREKRARNEKVVRELAELSIREQAARIQAQQETAAVAIPREEQPAPELQQDPVIQDELVETTHR